MDKETLTGYGWLIVCAMILAVMIAFATPFGNFVTTATRNTVDSLLDVNSKSIRPVQIPPNKTYTLEEIEDDETLFAIGGTQPEYVLAKFNKQYTAVTIFPNGEDSDGKVAKFAPWNGEASPLASYQETLQVVVFNEGITEAGSGNGSFYVFGSSPSITKVSLPETLEVIGDNLFYNCSNLKEIVLPNSLTKIGQGAFSYSGICDVSIPDTVTEMGNDAFSNCKNLKTVKLPANITKISRNTFNGCTVLSDIDIPGNITTIEYRAFANTAIRVASLKQITTIEDEAFMDCSQLSNVVFSPLLTEIKANTFSGCTSLRNLVFHSRLEKIGNGAFKGSGLNHITIPNGVTNIGDSAFEDCSNLSRVTFNTNLSYIPARAFKNCVALTSVEIPGNIKTIKEEAFYGAGLTTVTLKSGVQTIENKSFANCKINSITIPDSLTNRSGTALQGIESTATIYCQSGDMRLDILFVVGRDLPATVNVIVDTTKF
jgi:hypothetical protein